MYSVFLKIKKKNASFTTLGMGRVEPPSIGIEDETSNESNSFEGELNNNNVFRVLWNNNCFRFFSISKLILSWLSSLLMVEVV